jgi:hypothetical protein
MKPPTVFAALAAVARYAQAQMDLPALSALSSPLLLATSAALRGEALKRVSASDSLSLPPSPSAARA